MLASGGGELAAAYGNHSGIHQKWKSFKKWNPPSGISLLVVQHRWELEWEHQCTGVRRDSSTAASAAKTAAINLELAFASPLLASLPEAVEVFLIGGEDILSGFVHDHINGGTL